MSLNEVFGRTSQNNHNENKVFWAAGENNERQTAILPAVLLELPVNTSQQSQSAPSNYKRSSLFVTNVMSLVLKIDEVRVVTNSISPDFLSMTETWLQEHFHSNVVKINGHDLVRRDKKLSVCTLKMIFSMNY